MGSLKPGVTYIHERVGKTVYTREFGADPSTRQVAGWDYDSTNPTFDPRPSGQKEVDDLREWTDIRLAGKKNPTLQKAIENVKIVYRMVKDDNE
jgi:hypothetical protein